MYEEAKKCPKCESLKSTHEIIFDAMSEAGWFTIFVTTKFDYLGRLTFKLKEFTYAEEDKFKKNNIDKWKCENCGNTNYNVKIDSLFDF